ncbi:polysaccharide deacetylase family protein [Sphaerotilus sp.]|uniref:polysaccharide deacetylase family protein n=1 Tax=Sphaerotilus sp. TaxID=2093942 RepID=UPI0034E19A44
MSTRFRFCFLFASLMLAGMGPACSQVAIPLPSASEPGQPVHGEHTHPHALLRQAHLTRLEERLSTDQETLRRQCRFVSDISTAPPQNKVVLTFDDGPEPDQIEYILEVLDKYSIPATFFFIGDKMAQHPDLVAKVQEKKRHLIGSHSWDHPNFHDIDENAQRSAIMRGLEQMPAGNQARYFRYPYGNSSCFGNDTIHQQGYHITGWHVDTCDWAFDRNGSVDTHEALSCGVLSQYRHDFVGHVVASLRARRGGIVLMHEIHPNTLRQLERLIQEMQADGFTFTSLDDPAMQASMR